MTRFLPYSVYETNSKEENMFGKRMIFPIYKCRDGTEELRRSLSLSCTQFTEKNKNILHGIIGRD